MATLSFRDRFYSPPVAHAVTSPSAILALGAGAAVGILALPFTGPLVVAGAIIGGIAGYGGRVALAIPKKGKGERIDAFAVNEPWRHSVRDAIKARDHFGDAAKAFKPGPLHDRMAEMSGQLDDAVADCWRIAQQGQVVADARKRINDREANWEREHLVTQVPPGGRPNATQSKTMASLDAQLATAARMDALIQSTREQLDLINARMDEAVTQAVELSVSNRSDQLDPLGNDVEGIVDDLASLRLALEDVDGPAGS
ncbi:MAG: hypothetical protein ACR2MB_00250 [Acidimicrobiales bacterium]